MNMYKWVDEILSSTEVKALPILTFPSIQKLNVNVKTLLCSSELMSEAMKIISSNYPMCIASLAFMDLSIEAECFGSEIVFPENEVPLVKGAIVDSEDAVNDLKVPDIDIKRAKLAIETIKKAKEKITDRPVIAGCIGCFSLAGRLCGITDALIYIYEEKELMHALLKKTSEFLKKYILALKDAGADGLMIAEPLAGLLSPDLADEFSSKYLKEIVESVQDESFIVIYHNCGNYVPKMIDSIVSIGAKGLHFGNSIDLTSVFPKINENILVMGNVDPAGEFVNGSVESISKVTNSLLEKFSSHRNFVISSGCDIPPSAKFENINSFFETIKKYNAKY